MNKLCGNFSFGRKPVKVFADKNMWKLCAQRTCYRLTSRAVSNQKLVSDAHMQMVAQPVTKISLKTFKCKKYNQVGDEVFCAASYFQDYIKNIGKHMSSVETTMTRWEYIWKMFFFSIIVFEITELGSSPLNAWTTLNSKYISFLFQVLTIIWLLKLITWTTK